LIASAAGIERDFSAITPASTDASAGTDGTPLYCTTAIPAFANVLARSLDPVKSSPIQPSNIVLNHPLKNKFKNAFRRFAAYHANR
jgi:hypothetical protein